MSKQSGNDDEIAVETLGRIVERAAIALGEHFDSVRIFVTKAVTFEGKPQTAAITRGSGNIYAARGQVNEWMLRQHRQSEMDEEDSRDAEQAMQEEEEETGDE